MYIEEHVTQIFINNVQNNNPEAKYIFISFGDKYFAFSCLGKCYDWLKFTYVLRGKYMV